MISRVFYSLRTAAWGGVFTLAGLSGANAEVLMGSAPITFKATFIKPTCQIDSEPLVEFGSVPSSTIRQNGLSTLATVTVSLFGCQGGAGATPMIEVTGTETVLDDGLRVFKTGGDSQGYGVQLNAPTEKVTQISQNKNPVDKGLSSGTRVEIGSSTTAVSSLDGDYDFSAQLSCGECADIALLRGGELTASVTFSFLYE